MLMLPNPEVPQGLKPMLKGAVSGTAEAVPFQGGFMRQRVVISLADYPQQGASTTFLIRSNAQSISARVMTSGGAIRITRSCVSLHSKPATLSASQ